MSNERFVGFKLPVTCSWCARGIDPDPGKLICGSCVRKFDLLLCSRKYQKVRKLFMVEHPYCVNCFRNQVRPTCGFELNKFTLGSIESTPTEFITTWHCVCNPFPRGIVSVPVAIDSLLYRPLFPDQLLSGQIQTGVLHVNFPLGCSALPPMEANVLDHVKTWRQFPSLFLEPTNWQPLCNLCHNVKTIQHDGGFGRIRST